MAPPSAVRLALAALALGRPRRDREPKRRRKTNLTARLDASRTDRFARIQHATQAPIRLPSSLYLTSCHLSEPKRAFEFPIRCPLDPILRVVELRLSNAREHLCVSSRNLQKIARSEALEDASSAEQLDQRMVVISSYSWLLLVIVMIGMLITAFWSFLGRIPKNINGEGLLIESNLPVSVRSSNATGTVSEILADVGSIVEKGQRILIVDNREIDEQIANAASFLEVLKRQNVAMEVEESLIIEKQMASVENQVALASETLEQTRQLVKMYESEVGDLEALVAKKLIPNTELVRGRASLFTAMQQVSQQNSIIAQAEAALESSLSTIEQNRLSRAQQTTQAQNSLDQLRIKGEQATSVIAPVGGRLIEHKVGVGSFVSPGTSVATILLMKSTADASGGLKKEYSAILYLPYGTGKQVREGMPAEISLPFAAPSRYGYIKATVKSVATFVSGSGLAVHLGSEELAKRIQGDIQTPLEITVSLEPDDSTISGLAWTSTRGYPDEIPLLSLCNVQITVQESRPIDLVIPWLKDVVGIDQPPQVRPGPS